MKMHFSFVHKKINQLSVSDFFKDCEPNCLLPEDPKLLLQLTHLLSVSYFSASQGVFLRAWTGLLSIYGPAIFWTPTGDPLQNCHGGCTDQRPSRQKFTLGWSSEFRNGHSDTKHIDKWFQQYTNSDAGLKPDSDTLTAARAGSAFDVLTEKWSFVPYDLAYSREIFYKKIQFYCIVNIIWQLKVKVSSLIALNETKHSQIHTYMGKRFIMCSYSSGENSTEIISELKALPEDAVSVLIQSLLLQSMFSLQLWFCSWRTQAQAILRYFALLLKCFAVLLFVCRQLGCPLWFSKVI